MSALSPIADILGLRDSKKKATGTMAGPPVHLQDFCSFPSWEYASTVALTPVSSDPRNCLSQTCIRMGVTQGRWHSWRPCCLWLRLVDPNRRLLRTRCERPRSRYNSRPFDEIASSHWLAPMATMELQQGFAIDEMGFRGQFEQQQFPPADVRFGSQADIGEGASDVRFTSNSRHPCPKRKGPARWPVPPIARRAQ